MQPHEEEGAEKRQRKTEKATEQRVRSKKRRSKRRIKEFFFEKKNKEIDLEKIKYFIGIWYKISFFPKNTIFLS
jgi:hypothetical protein